MKSLKRFLCQIAGVHFVLRGKNAGNFELVYLISKSHATVVLIPGGGYYTLLKFLRHLLFTQLTNSKSNARKNGQYCIKT